jgi:hypothetical protein
MLYCLRMAVQGNSLYVQQRVSDIAHFCEMQSHYIFYYDQQEVSDTAQQSDYVFLQLTGSE